MTAAAACASAPLPPPAPPPDPRQVALALERATLPERSARIIFEWTLIDGPARLRGRGVARFAAPDRVRFDLFSPQGETMARAVVVGDELRLPEYAEPVPIPDPPFVWAALGVFRPGANAALLGADRAPDHEIRLRYALLENAATLVYGIRGRQLRWIERRQNNQAVERVELVFEAASRFPLQATYRDLRAYRELRVRLDTIEDVESYPLDIWVPGR